MARPARLVAFLPPALLLLVLLLWLRSYLPDDFYCRPVHGRVVLFYLNGPYSHWLEPTATDHQGADIALDQLASGSDLRFRFAGVEVLASNWNVYPTFAVLAVPFGWLALPLAVASGWSIASYRRRRAWAATGRCRQCGYDLRATTTTCPECGTPRQ
jgi:hypothetical protein